MSASTSIRWVWGVWIKSFEWQTLTTIIYLWRCLCISTVFEPRECFPWNATTHHHPTDSQRSNISFSISLCINGTLYKCPSDRAHTHTPITIWWVCRKSGLQKDDQKRRQWVKEPDELVYVRRLWKGSGWSNDIETTSVLAHPATPNKCMW